MAKIHQSVTSQRRPHRWFDEQSRVKEVVCREIGYPDSAIGEPHTEPPP